MSLPVNKVSTADLVAAARAWHLRSPQPVFEDRFARVLCGRPLGITLRFRPLEWLVFKVILGPVLPAYVCVVMRARYAEEALERAVAEGVTQYVIIGAGMDSFAFRRARLAAEDQCIRDRSPSHAGKEAHAHQASGAAGSSKPSLRRSGPVGSFDGGRACRVRVRHFPPSVHVVTGGCVLSHTGILGEDCQINGQRIAFRIPHRSGLPAGGGTLQSRASRVSPEASRLCRTTGRADAVRVFHRELERANGRCGTQHGRELPGYRPRTKLPGEIRQGAIRDSRAVRFWNVRSLA